MLAITAASLAFAPLSGISLPRASDASATVDLGALSGAKTLVVFGTYPADFNSKPRLPATSRRPARPRLSAC